MATDDDNTRDVTDAVDSITYTLEGGDKGKFNINDAGVLTFTGTADFEDKSSYSITIVAISTGAGDADNQRLILIAVRITAGML